MSNKDGCAGCGGPLDSWDTCPDCVVSDDDLYGMTDEEFQAHEEAAGMALDRNLLEIALAMGRGLEKNEQHE